MTAALPAVPECSAAELARDLDAGTPLQLLDIRAPARVAEGHVDLGPPERFHQRVGSEVRRMASLAEAGLDPALPVVVVCGRGNDSRLVAAHLAGLGATARSLRGGMAEWMRLVVLRPLAPPPSLDRLLQGDRVGKGALGYLLVSDGEALLVDPPRDAAPWLDAVEAAGARLVAIAETHVHADYLSGGAALASTLGVPYHLHPADAVDPYDGTPGRVAFTPLADGASLRVGRATVRVCHTPGHTEGSVSFLVDDALALTGDFLFVRSIGRPDLAGRTEPWARALWASVQRARADWPRAALVLPAHYSSPAERRADGTVAAPLGTLLGTNEVLRLPGEAAFLDWVRAHRPAFPDAYRRIKALNLGLDAVDDEAADALDLGRNACALG
ncbi:MAG: MBL fold metallo-hydrolase [Gemmatimonadales bacterium]|nr:MBL fold metallo-hydrolase [Gemmatimonadales bacterium]